VTPAARIEHNVRLDEQACRDRMLAARVGYLATAGAAHQPHVVPVTFAVVDDRIVTAVDQKPKSTTALRRLQNIAENPLVAILCDHYDEDWRRLWWVRADGASRIIDDDATRDAALHALMSKYPQYRDDPPRGPILLVMIRSWTGWQYGDRAAAEGRRS
jgi:PPOX class probable F420-dependent enzyme